MLDVNDYKLVSLEALVHDEALFASYMNLVSRVASIFEREKQFVAGKIDLGRDYVFAEPVLERECQFWSDDFYDKTPENFVRWAYSRKGYFDSFASADEFGLHLNILVDKKTQTALGRTALFMRERAGEWSGAGFDLIHPDHRKKGLGAIILAHRFQEAAENGVVSMKINVAADNLGSLRRLWKLKAANLVKYSEPLGEGGELKHDREISWIDPRISLERAHAILSSPLKNEPEPMEYYFTPC